MVSQITSPVDVNPTKKALLLVHVFGGKLDVLTSLNASRSSSREIQLSDLDQELYPSAILSVPQL